MKTGVDPKVGLNKRFCLVLFILILITFSCKKGMYSVGRLDTVRVEYVSYTDTCSKSIHFDNYDSGYYYRIAEKNRYENLLCSGDYKHYRMVNEGQCIDFRVTADGNKFGSIHLTFIDTKKQDVSFEDQIIAWEIPINDEAVQLAFELIDSLHADSIYSTRTESLNIGERLKSNCDFVYEFSTPNNYYLQYEPMCKFDDMPCRRWIRKLSILEARINQILLPYHKPIEQLESELKNNGIVKI